MNVKQEEHLYWLIVALIFIVGYVVCAIAYAKPDEWRGKMKEMSYVLSETIPFLYPDPQQDSKGLTVKIKKIRDITRELDVGLNHSMLVPDTDPALPYIADLFRRDIEQAYDSLEEGHTEYAKGVIRSSISYCVTCHTRSNTTVQFPMLKSFEGPLKKAPWIDRIEFQAATRQFDTVLSDVMSQLAKPAPAGKNSLDLERATRVALAIAVRVKRDPVKARLLAQAVKKSPVASQYMKTAAEIWGKDVADWQSETQSKFTTDKLLLEAARKLLKPRPDVDLSSGPHNEVRLLRASNLMHDLLARFPNSEFVPEALYTIGLSYSSLRDLGSWSLHEMYFAACINKVPHTAQAEKCFKEYESSIVMGYSGSSGVHIPGAVSRHLARMKELAQAENKKR